VASGRPAASYRAADKRPLLELASAVHFWLYDQKGEIGLANAPRADGREVVDVDEA
jgi:hypothetical protein